MKKLVLGTAQFGTLYGINNKVGKPSEDLIFKILNLAHKSGIEILDTAEDYGNAQFIIGKFHKLYPQSRFKIISKISHQSTEAKIIARKVGKDLGELCVKELEAYLFHSYSLYKRFPELIKELLPIQQEGRIKKIGISIYNNTELADVILDDRIKLIQLPLNLLDNMYQKGQLLAKAKDKGKEINVRSVFLQGLFFMKDRDFPQKLKPLQKYFAVIADLARRSGLTSEELALQYVYHHKYVDKVLIGVDTVQQLERNIDSLKKPVDRNIFDEINKIKVEEVDLLNPVNW